MLVAAVFAAVGLVAAGVGDVDGDTEGVGYELGDCHGDAIVLPFGADCFICASGLEVTLSAIARTAKPIITTVATAAIAEIAYVILDIRFLTTNISPPHAYAYIIYNIATFSKDVELIGKF